jgi:hypothetical protein
MQERYALRFESGERSGEMVPVPAGGLTLGRRPGNSVQIPDASVSGRHAQVEVRGGEVVLRDLGSTNGTRVGGERISEQRLAHGDELQLGNVRLVFVDLERGSVAPADDAVRMGDTPPLGLPLEEGLGLEEPAATPVPAASPARAPASRPSAPPEPVPAATAADVGDDVGSISADRVERSRSRSLLGLAGVLLILAVGAGAWWWLGRQGPRQSARAVSAVEPVDGNLLAQGYSFEEQRGGWEGDERSPAGFEVDPAARRSGEVGLRAELGDGAGDWALVRSSEVRLASARGLRGRGWLRAEGGAEGLLGVRLESSGGEASPLVVWSDPLGAEGEGEVELALAVPPVYDRARALLLARLSGGATVGSVDADDVSLVSAAAPGAPLRVDEFEVHALGQPARALSLVKIGRALANLELCAGAPALETPRVALELEAAGAGVRILPAGAGDGPRTLRVEVEPALASQGLASTGAEGYRVHQTEFEREAVSALLLGRGRDLVRLDLGGGDARVRGRPEGGAFHLEADLSPGAELSLQLAFREERATAQELAADARRAADEGRIGDALATWKRVLDEFPYEPELVEEAARTRGQLEQQGLEELQLVRVRLERARFFRLVDVYRRCRDGARAVAEGYAPSDVAAEAAGLLDEIQGELAVLERELDRAERHRLAAIERALRAQGAEKLAARVRERLEARFGALAPAEEGD